MDAKRARAAMPARATASPGSPVDDDGGDEFRHGEVMDVIRDHDDRMNRNKSEMEEHKAAYLTAWWDWVGDGGRRRRYKVAAQDCVEVNRAWGGVETHAAQLSPRSRRAVVGRDELGRGDPRAFQGALNAWWRRPGNIDRITASIRMSTLYPGSGFKVRLLPGRGNPIERVELSVVPPWEMVLDYDAADPSFERYRGHAYWLPVSKVEAMYPHLRGRVTGCQRTDFLSPLATGGKGTTGGGRDVKWDTNVVETEYPVRRRSKDRGAADFVRVFEFYNLVDAFDAGGGVVLQGRLDVYLLDQDDAELRGAPAARRAIPFSSADGVPLPNPVPVVFAHEPEFMLRPVSPLRRYMPQQRELNLMRTEMMRRVRKHVRKVFYREADWKSDNKSKYSSPEDMEMIGLLGDGEPSRAVYVTPPPPPDPEFKEYMALVERDLDRVQALSPNRRGEVTKATAYEIQSVNLFDETEFGKHASSLDQACQQVSQLVRAALALALQQPGDSEGGYTAPVEGQKYAATAVVDGDAAPAVDVAASVAAEATGKSAAGVEGEALPVAGGPPPVPVSVGVVAPGGTVAAVAQQSFSVLDPETDRMVVVTVDALDGNFTVTFVEGAQTPMTEQAQAQNLLGVQAVYQDLWKQAQQETPDGLLARRTMAAIHDKLKLPRDMHPDALLSAWKEEQARKPAAAPPAEVVEATRPAPTGGEQKLVAELEAMARAAGAGPVATAIGEAIAATRARDIEATATALSAAREAASMAGVTDIEARLTTLLEIVAGAAQSTATRAAEGSGQEGGGQEGGGQDAVV